MTAHDDPTSELVGTAKFLQPRTAELLLEQDHVTRLQCLLSCQLLIDAREDTNRLLDPIALGDELHEVVVDILASLEAPR